jgi:hypothetical protein
MNDDPTALRMAQEGLRQIEQAILRLLDRNPQGLRNSEIATQLKLVSYFKGGQKNRLTHAVLGGLLVQGKVVQDDITKKFINVLAEDLPDL